MSVNLVGPDGREYVLDNEDPAALQEAFRQGFKQPIEREQSQGLADELAAAGAEATDVAGTALLSGVSGLTGGLSDVALGKSEDNRAAAQFAAKQREKHPLASGAGELAGMVASPINLVGGAVQKSLRATTALGRMGAAAAGGASSGLLFGAGKAISDAALGDTELTAEKLIAGAGLGALLGGLGGGVGGAIEEGARAVLPSVRTLAGRAQSALDDIANDAAISSTRAQQSVINKIGDEKLAAVAKALRERGHLESTPEKMAESVAKDRAALGKTLGKFLDDADAAGSKADHMRLLGRLDDFEARLNPLERDAIAADLRAARKAVAQLGEEGSGFRALDDLKQTIQAKAKFSRGPTPLDDTTLGLKRGLAGVFRDEIDQQLLPQLGSEGAKAFTEAKATYGALKDAERLAQSGMSRVGERGALTYIGLKDLLAGVIGSQVHPMGIAAALGSKVLREHGPAIVARLADKLAKEPALSAMAKSFAASLPQTAPRLGQYGAILAQEAAISPERALAAHIAHAQLDPGYAATAQLAGLTPEEPDEHMASLGRAQSLAEATAAAQAADEGIKRQIDRVVRGNAAAMATSSLKSQDFGAMRMRRDAKAAHDKRVEEVRRLATDPNALVERIAANMGPLGNTAPAVASSMTNTAARAVAYLAKQAEVPPKAGPLAPAWEVPEADRFSFAQKLEAVQDPLSVLEHAAAGTLTEEQVEAVRAVYPRLAKHIADAALERMTEGPSVPYRAKVMLNLLTGIDPDGTLSPEAIAANQSAIAAAGKSDGAPGAQGAPKREADISLAKRSATPSQRREMRTED